MVHLNLGVMATESVDYIQPDITQTDGILEAKKSHQ